VRAERVVYPVDLLAELLSIVLTVEPSDALLEE
jgi:hypothetical protein